MSEDNSWIWVSLIGALLALVVVFMSCDESGYPLGADYAKGGNPGKPADEIVIDSVTIVPADTTIAPGDSVQFHALLWVDGQPYIHCPDYSLAIPYTGDREACASYEPKGKGRYKT